MEKPWAIVSGGRFSPLTDLEKCGYVIACDKGYVYLAERGLRPDLLVGDFDSYTGPLPQEVPRLDLPVEKDDTDTMAAIRHAVTQAKRFGCTAPWVAAWITCWEICRRRPLPWPTAPGCAFWIGRTRSRSLPPIPSLSLSGRAGLSPCWLSPTNAPVSASTAPNMSWTRSP